MTLLISSDQKNIWFDSMIFYYNDLYNFLFTSLIFPFVVTCTGLFFWFDLISLVYSFHFSLLIDFCSLNSLLYINEKNVLIHPLSWFLMSYSNTLKWHSDNFTFRYPGRPLASFLFCRPKDLFKYIPHFFFSLGDMHINFTYYLLFLNNIFEKVDVHFSEIWFHIIGTSGICDPSRERFSNMKGSFKNYVRMLVNVATKEQRNSTNSFLEWDHGVMTECFHSQLHLSQESVKEFMNSPFDANWCLKTKIFMSFLEIQVRPRISQIIWKKHYKCKSSNIIS